MAPIDDRQRKEGWGAAIIPRLARELRNESPEEKGENAIASGSSLSIAPIAIRAQLCHGLLHN
jgi:hypothetical protein